MKTLGRFSVWIISLGLILLLFPGSGRYTFRGDPETLFHEVMREDVWVSPDEVAGYLATEDTALQLIDLRSSEEYEQFSIPGAINIPIEAFFSSRPETWLYDQAVRYIFYGHEDLDAAFAVTLARGLGYENTQAMAGGLTRWFEDVLYSTYTGQTVTPAVNALFEKRYRARRFFHEYNALPDSLKLKYIQTRRQTEQSLDGGCE